MSEPKYSQKDIDRAKADGQLAETLDSIKREVHSINDKLDKNYVTIDQLETFKVKLDPIIKIVYGLVGLALSSLMAGGLAFVINK
jgi:hypothetical protein